MNKSRALDDVKVGDVVRGYSQTSHSIVNIVVQVLRDHDGFFVGVSGFRVNDDGTIKNRKMQYIGKGLPGSKDFAEFTDFATGEKTSGGWTYPDITIRKRDGHGKWARPIKELGVGATVDFDCSVREVDTIRVVAARQGSYWNKQFKVEKTLSGCAVTRKV